MSEGSSAKRRGKAGRLLAGVRAQGASQAKQRRGPRRVGESALVMRLIWTGLLPLSALGFGMAGVGAVVGGAPAAAGVALATVMVTTSLAITVLLHPLLAATNPSASLGLALGVYSLKIGVAVWVVTMPQVHETVSAPWFCVTLVAGVCATMVVHIAAMNTARLPVLPDGHDT